MGRSGIGPIFAKRARIAEGEALLVESWARARNNVIRRYGEDVLALTENDESLLAHMETGDPELQTFALWRLDPNKICIAPTTYRNMR